MGIEYVTAVTAMAMSRAERQRQRQGGGHGEYGMDAHVAYLLSGTLQLLEQAGGRMARLFRISGLKMLLARRMTG
jgi:hypothetical protein